jgi:hypothetical protein
MVSKSKEPGRIVVPIGPKGRVRHPEPLTPNPESRAFEPRVPRVA